MLHVGLAAHKRLRHSLDRRGHSNGRYRLSVAGGLLGHNGLGLLNGHLGVESASDVLGRCYALGHHWAGNGRSCGNDPMVHRNWLVVNLFGHCLVLNALLLTVLSHVLVSRTFLRNIVNILVLNHSGNVVSDVLHGVVVGNLLFVGDDFDLLHSFILRPDTFLRDILNATFSLDSRLLLNLGPNELGLLQRHLLLLHNLSLNHWLLHLNILSLSSLHRLLVLDIGLGDGCLLHLISSLSSLNRLLVSIRGSLSFHRLLHSVGGLGSLNRLLVSVGSSFHGLLHGIGCGLHGLLHSVGGGLNGRLHSVRGGLSSLDWLLLVGVRGGLGLGLGGLLVLDI